MDTGNINRVLLLVVHFFYETLMAGKRKKTYNVV